MQYGLQSPEWLFGQHKKVDEGEKKGAEKGRRMGMRMMGMILRCPASGEGRDFWGRS